MLVPQNTLNNNNCFSCQQVTEEMRAEQTSLSAKARELYENSVKMYSQQAPSPSEDTHRAIPVHLDKATSTQQHQLQHSPQQQHSRLRHLPPVHVTDAQLHRGGGMRNFHIRPRHTREVLPEELRKEINWSVAELREMFSSGARARCGDFGERMPQLQQHTRSRSLSSRSEEESFV